MVFNVFGDAFLKYSMKVVQSVGNTKGEHYIKIAV